jgi:hypothetical protein
MSALTNNPTLRSLIAMFILITVTLAVDDGTASQDFSKVKGTSQVSSVDPLKRKTPKLITSTVCTRQVQIPSVPTLLLLPVRAPTPPGSEKIVAR